jgi:hypothetical protein
MRILKSNPLLKLVNGYLIDAPQPSNINYLWNFGSLLAVCLGIQIITGVTLAMHYNPSLAEAFNSIEHIKSLVAVIIILIITAFSISFKTGFYKLFTTYSKSKSRDLNYKSSNNLNENKPNNLDELPNNSDNTDNLDELPNNSDNTDNLDDKPNNTDNTDNKPNNSDNLDNENKPNYPDEFDPFLKWFVGFTDAEGNFLISFDRGFIRFRFKISMHIDNIDVLYLIKLRLGVGSVITEKARNRCSFVVQDFAGIRDVICPIFLKIPLQTSKNLDFQDFNQAVTIKNKKKLSKVYKEKILSLKNGMNSQRELFKNNSINSQIKISPEWFIGFLEGEGTLGIKTGSSMYIQVAQKNTSIFCINAIIAFLNSLESNLLDKPKDLDKDKPRLPINVSSTINTKTDVISIVVSSVDALFNYILPLLDSQKMYTFKEMDFKLWRMALLLKIYGYYYLPEGKNLFLDISNILNKRYSTGSIENINDPALHCFASQPAKLEDIFNRYQAILNIDPPFKDNLDKPHVDNVRKYRLENKSDLPKTIYIYENDELIKGSPFKSYVDAHKALGLKSTSNTCNRYLDTNRIYKSKYKLTSIPITTE